MTTYLKRFYFDDRKLRQRALIELMRALESGRLIAFTGSMATESYGYGDWAQLIGRYIHIAQTLAQRRSPGTLEFQAIQRMGRFAAVGGDFDKRVALSVVKEALGAIDQLSFPQSDTLVAELERQAAKIFGRRRISRGSDDSTVDALIEQLGVRRYATLNYDLELERALMVEPHEASAVDQPLEVIEKLRERGRILDTERVPHKLSRLMTNGRMVESDIRDRERPDRMIEFAVGSVEVDQRIMHLHGRACSPATMIVGLRDYDRLYRRHDLAKLPFEHGQRILFAGNPILFVGVGMTEPEVNATLQTFVSNNPYRRFAPTFLLWNTSDFSEDDTERSHEVAAKRIDFLQRLGIFTIFDEDLLQDGAFKLRLKNIRAAHHKIRMVAASTQREKTLLRRRKVNLLAATIGHLSNTAKALHAESNYQASSWRSMHDRMTTTREGQPVTIWGILRKPEGRPLPKERLTALTAGPGSAVQKVIIGPPGSGKGSMGWHLARESRGAAPFSTQVTHRLLINGGFAFDTDSLLIAISRFLLKIKGDPNWETGPTAGRESQFLSKEALRLPGTQAVVIINGMERFFTVTGAPLSAELDQLLRRLAGLTTAESDVSWCFLGPERTRRYFEAIGGASIIDIDCLRDNDEGVQEAVSSRYLTTLLRNFERKARSRGVASALSPAAEATLLNHGRGDPEAMRRAAFAALLEPHALARVGISDGIGLEILRAMAFIGSPVEDLVLLHAPRIRRALSGARPADTLRKALNRLLELELVIQIGGFENYPPSSAHGGMWRRFGLHPSLSSELRHQFGVPLSESKLSTAFNMSLYVAQPVDGYVPEPAIHDELAELIDFLIGTYKDDASPCEKPDLSQLPGWETILRETARSFVPPLSEAEQHPERLARLVSPVAVAALRSALAVLRGYYSTTSLLTIDRGDRLASEDRDGVLLEHAERLERLLRAHTKISRFREALVRQAGRNGFPAEERIRQIIGPEPFYPDDVVWMQNELGVVALAQGDLYGARSALQKAMRVNHEAVEFGSRSHNWRRITLNQAFLDIERARLTIAEKRLAQIERSINDRPILHHGDSGLKPDRNRFATIRKWWGDSAGPEVSCFHKEIMHEELLMTALVLGYRGVSHHVRGHLLSAVPLYKDALTILRRLGEHRAYANFQRHYAQLHSELDPDGKDSVPMRLAVAAAESVRQMDMAYYARIIQAASRSSGADTLQRRQALQQLNDAFSYSALMDLHRLRIEVAGRLARVKLHSGDYETALEHATEAMAIAARFGHSLRKIGVRILIGQILIRRGDPKSGNALIDAALEAADRFGYQRAVEIAQRVRAEEGLPS